MEISGAIPQPRTTNPADSIRFYSVRLVKGVHETAWGTREFVIKDAQHREGTTVNRRLISSGSSFETEVGYSRAVVDGDWVFVSGTTGFDYRSMTISDDLGKQTEQAMRNIQSALEQAGASLRDVVRVTYILPEAKDFPQCWPILRKYLGDVRPAATMISAGLADPRIRIEIEVTAHRQAR
jgi:enamine deaminase RidA (YjgF/YER057c/UK114 family)